MDRQTDRQTDRWTDIRTDRWTGRQTDGWMDRPYPPVGQLVLFVSLHVAAVLQKEDEGVPGKIEHATGLTCIKQVDHVDSKVSLQPLDIPICTMHHLIRKLQREK